MRTSRFTYLRIVYLLRGLIRNDHLILALLAVIVGAFSGGAVILFREGIELVQSLADQVASERMFQIVAALPWWQVMLAPTVGGLVVGVLVRTLMPEHRPQGVADVIEYCALRGGRMSSRIGLVAAAVSAISIGTGASVGREGPAVHLGASLAGWIGRRLHLSQSLMRTLLGCGVAAAVGASFNAPIAGALFASEVVVGHYALKAFAPVVIASVAGTALSQAHFGDFPAFFLGDHLLTSFWEFPAIAGLGLVCGVAAIIFMRGIFLAQAAAERSKLPIWLRPAIAGLAVGGLTVLVPEVVGVGYGVTEWVMLGQFTFQALIIIALAKILATALCIGWGFGGGVFSPSLVIGAAIGAAYGIIATAIFPQLSSGAGAYAIIGMGAMAAAVLGAPISTTLIIFEITGDYALSIAVMVAIVVATEITHHLFGPSFFIMQLRRRGIDLKSGFEAEVMSSISVRKVLESATAMAADTVNVRASLQELRNRLQRSATGELFVVRSSGEFYGTITLADLSELAFEHDADDVATAADVARTHPPVLAIEDDLETAISLMRDTGEEHIAVVDDAETMIFKGCVHQRDVMNTYNRALIDARNEERGY